MIRRVRLAAPALTMALALLLAACAERPAVPERIQVTQESLPLSGYPKLPGRFVAQVQSGGWDLTISAVGSGCGVARIKADVNPAWEEAMRDALSQVLENVEFQSEAPTPERLQALGADAGIVIYQGNARPGFRVDEPGYRGFAQSEVRLSAVLGVLGRGGLIAQHTVQSSAGAQALRDGCRRLPETVTVAAQHAAGSVARDVARQLRAALARPPRPIR